MLTEVVRKCLSKVPNRFELVIITCERSRQLADGARPTIEPQPRERSPKVALTEIDAGKLVRDGENWRVERPGLADLFVDPAPSEVAGIADDLLADEEE